MTIVGGRTKVTRPTFAVQASPDYSDGDCIGGLITLTDFVARRETGGLIDRWTLRTALSGGITVQTFLHIFDSNPSASTFTDNSALSIHANDRSKILQTIAIPAASWSAPKGASPWYTVNAIGRSGIMEYLVYDLASGRDLYFAWEADGTINFAATTDVDMIISQLPSA